MKIKLDAGIYVQVGYIENHSVWLKFSDINNERNIELDFNLYMHDTVMVTDYEGVNDSEVFNLIDYLKMPLIHEISNEANHEGYYYTLFELEEPLEINFLSSIYVDGKKYYEHEVDLYVEDADWFKIEN